MRSVLLSFIPRHIRFLAGIYLLGLIFFTVFRVAFVMANADELQEIPGSGSLLFSAFVMGFRFDTVISCYILALPFLVFTVYTYIAPGSKAPWKFTYYFVSIAYSLSFLACAADIPYYKHFGSKLNSAAFSWLNSPGFVLKMIMEEFSYWGYIIIFVIIIWAFVFFLKRVRRKAGGGQDIAYSLLSRSAVFLAGAALIFLGMRGRIAHKSPIRIGTAYISSYAIINNTGLNPMFTLIKTCMYDMDKANRFIHLMDESKALANARQFLSLPTDSSFRRPLKVEGEVRKPNVVIVLMESMCTYKMGDYHGKLLARVMDSLRTRSLYFEHFYSAGIHTFNGIFSSLYAYPALLKQQPLKYNTSKKFYGIPGALKEKGYQTLYFTTHDEQFDNMGGFLQYNGFDRIISEKDYPSERSLSTLGVPDHYMFEYAVNTLNDASKKGDPFLAVLLTTSDHGPWVIPDDIPYKPDAPDEKQRATQYADWSIGQFLKNASAQSWYKNTLFIFLGDHGMSVSSTYDMPMSYHHIPCIFFGPGVIDSARTVKNFGGQIDLYPTLMGLLHMPVENNTPGIDLLHEQRPCMYFSADDKIGCIDDQYYYIYRNEEGKSTLYRYKDLSTEDLYPSLKAHADSMRDYAFSMLQASQWMIKNERFGQAK